MIPHIPQQDFGACVAVAVRPVMVQGNLIHGAHAVQPVADARKLGAADPDAGCCGSVYDLPADPLLHGSTVWEHGVMEQECRQLLEQFFHMKR